MKEIASVNNSYIKELSKLKEKKYQSQSDVFLVEGKHLVEEAYKHHCLKQILSDDESLFYKDIDCIKVSYDIIKKLSDTMNPQNIIGVVNKFNNDLNLNHVKSVILLDDINDPGNLGTIIRTSAGLGVDLIVLSKDTVDLYNPKVIRATQGAIFSLPIIKKDVLNFINELKKNNFYIYGTSLKGAIDLNEAQVKEKVGIVLGNEANGVKQEVLDQCDCLVKINITDKVESLNVAIAGAIVTYSLIH